MEERVFLRIAGRLYLWEHISDKHVKPLDVSKTSQNNEVTVLNVPEPLTCPYPSISSHKTTSKHHILLTESPTEKNTSTPWPDLTIPSAASHTLRLQLT
jgi:hypothetical protein